mgnify:CR=1 FL=1
MKIIGNPERFALGFKLTQDPDDGGFPHFRLSWGKFQVWVTGRNLTSGRAQDGSGVDFATVPLAPVVEWISKNWDPMLHEGRFPSISDSSSAAAWLIDSLASLPDDDSELDKILSERAKWWMRHGMGASLPDFRIPDLVLRRVNAGVELSWDDREWRSVPSGIHLMESPNAVILPALEVAEVLHEWASSVVNALRVLPAAANFASEMSVLLEGHASSKCALGRLKWAAGQRLEQAALEARHLLGITSDDIEETVRALLGLPDTNSAGLITPVTIPAMLFRSSNPELSTADLLTLSQAFARLQSEGDIPLCKFQRAEPPSASLEIVTQDGYTKAIELRSALSIDNSLPLLGECDLERVVLPRLGVIVTEVALDDNHIDGAAMFAPGSAPMILINLSGRFSSSMWGRRMTLAHELCHLLHDLSEDKDVAVVSNPWAPYLLERRANAFAAMFLMPPSAIGAVLPANPRQWTSDMLRHAMRDLGVGRSALTWHLYNLKRISGSERDALLDEL